MKGLRLRAAAVFTAISILSAYSMQLFLGLFYERNLPLVLGKLGSFNVIVAVLIVGANLFFWRVLGPIERASSKALSGAELSAEERARARRSGERAVNVVLVTIVLAYVAGPTAGIAANTALGISSYSLADVVLIFAINIAIGAASGTHIVLALENLLRGPLESLAVTAIGEGERYASIRGRILLAAGASGALLATCLVAAARGYLDAAAEGRLDPAAAGTQLLESAALAAVLLGWDLWLSATIASGVTARLRSMTARIEAIAEGGGDLSGRARIVRNDDIGRMASSFNRFLDSLERIVLATKGMAREARASAVTLAGSAVQARESVALLGKAQEESRGSAEAQGGAVEEARRRMAAMAASVDSVAERAAAQALEAERSSAAVGQMAANVAAVSRTAERADETAARLRADSAEGGEALRASLEAIRELEASSKSVREIVASISKIAAQTNLLAMNAAIEAAHAGEAGAGFAVVADEVRSLAGSAAKSAKEIVALIKDMSARIEAGAEKAGRAGAAFDRVREGVEGTGELVRTMAASMSEQRAGAEEILSAVGGLAEAARAIRGLSAAQRGESAGVVEAMDGIVAASERILEALQEEAGATSTLSRIVSLVSEESERTREGTAVLAEAVGRFRTRGES